MFVGEVFNGMVGYLSFSPSLILVTSTEGGPRGFPYQGLSPQYTHTKSKTVRWGWSLIQRLVVLLLATEGLSVIRSYDLWKKKKKTKSSPQLFQDSECWPSWELNGSWALKSVLDHLNYTASVLDKWCWRKLKSKILIFRLNRGAVSYYLWNWATWRWSDARLHECCKSSRRWGRCLQAKKKAHCWPNACDTVGD